jgi:hypothetical protein
MHRASADRSDRRDRAEPLDRIEGMSVLRNLVAHVRGDIGVDHARDYLALADAVLYALRPKPSS